MLSPVFVWVVTILREKPKVGKKMEFKSTFVFSRKSYGKCLVCSVFKILA